MKSNCKSCSKSFEHSVPQKYCTKECRLIDTHGLCMICNTVMQSINPANRGNRAHLECVKSVGISKICDYVKCQKEFTARTLGAKFCCRSHAAQQSQIRKGFPCTVCGEPVQRQPRGSSTPTHRECREPLPARSKTASIRRLPRKLRDEVLSRDKMTCQICFRTCTRDGGRLSWDYPTIDHIVPLVDFLHLEQEEAIRQANNLTNLRCSHRECNLKKNRF